MKYRRLTEKNSRGEWIVRQVEDYSDYASIFGSDGNYYLIGDVVDRLAELEDKIENGTLVELPCKIGDIFYTIRHLQINERQVSEISYYNGKWGCYDYDGEWYYITEIYFTKKQAEERLKELKGKNEK